MQSLYELCTAQVSPHSDLPDEVNEDIDKFRNKNKKFLEENLMLCNREGTVVIGGINLLTGKTFQERILARHYRKVLIKMGFNSNRNDRKFLRVLEPFCH